jgi:hypothetical protein
VPDIDKQVERGLKVVVAGWGDEVLLGVLAVYFKKIDPAKMSEYIDNNRHLTSLFTEAQINKFRRIGRPIHIEKITSDKILGLLKKEAPSAYVTLQFHPKGMSWLNSEIEDIKKTLTSPP